MSEQEETPRRRRTWPRWVALLVLGAGVTALFAWQPAATAPGAGPGGGRPGPGGPRGERGPTPVRTATIEAGAITERATYPGELHADAAELSANVGGRLVAVNVRIGAVVAKGAEIARLDDTDWRRQKAEAEAQAKAAAAEERRAAVDLEAARRDLERTEKLLGDQLVSEQQVDTLRARAGSLEAAVQAAAARRTQARAAIATLEQKIADCTIAAPFAGVVAARHHDPGTWLPAGAAVVRLVARSPLRVRFEVPEADVRVLREEAPLTARTQATGDAEFEGQVTGFAAEVDRARRVVRAEGVIDTPPPHWLPGMYAEVLVIRQALTDVPVVPASALLARAEDDGTEHFGVFAFEGERARWVEVRVRGREGDRVAIESALPVGTPVLTGGHADLSDGAPVKLAGDRR